RLQVAGSCLGRYDHAARSANADRARRAGRVSSPEPAPAATARRHRAVRFGRPPSLTPHQRREAMERLAQGAAQAELARSYGVSQSTISRLAAPGPFEASAVGA